MKTLNLFVLFALILILPIGHAHLDGGSDKVIGNYLVDFGFLPEQPKTTEKVTLSFSLLNETTKEVIEPTSVWIRISSPEEIVFAGTFHPEAKHVAFTYLFPKANIYEILVRFKDNDNILVETSFQLNVSGAISNQTSSFMGYRLTFILGVINIISLLLVFFSCRCLVGASFIKKMWKYKWYQKYYHLHCYYWWALFISIILHVILALVTFGNPL